MFEPGGDALPRWHFSDMPTALRDVRFQRGRAENICEAPGDRQGV